MEEIEYHLNGKIAREWPMLNGEYHGVQKTYWNNGNIYCHYYQNNGEYDRMFERWNENGSREFIHKIKMSRSHGTQIDFEY